VAVLEGLFADLQLNQSLNYKIGLRFAIDDDEPQYPHKPLAYPIP
jgi:hypothetical protein